MRYLFVICLFAMFVSSSYLISNHFKRLEAREQFYRTAWQENRLYEF